MALWMKKEDGTLVEVSGGSGGSGDGGGPHDHDEYAVVEHDHDEFTHDHNYLPLTGGTLTGTLWLAGGKSLSSIYGYNDPTRTVLRLVAGGDHVSHGAMLSLYGGDDATSPHMVRFHTNNKTTFELNADQSAKVLGDLQVDGVTTVHGPKGFLNLSELVSPPDDHWTSLAGIWSGYGMHAGTQGGYMTSMTSNGYRIADSKWKSLGVNGQVGAAQIDLAPTGHFFVRVASNHPTGSASNAPTRLSVSDTRTTVHTDLQVDGNLTVKSGGGATNAAIGFNGIDGMGIYSSAANNYMRFGVAGAQRMAIKEGVVVVNTDLQVDGTITDKNGPVRSFSIAEDIDTAEVLDRAETATMPVIDDEGVATTDADVESVTVNEVVTALLAKVKQLSDRIEELEGN